MRVLNEKLVLKKVFPQKAKLVDKTLVPKREDSTLVKNYRPLSVLPIASKILGKLMQKQTDENVDQFPSPLFVVTEENIVHKVP